MDFGKILDDWESGKSRPAAKKKKKEWIDQYVPGEEDLLGKSEPEKSLKTSRSLEKKLKKAPQDTLDLHGYTALEAQQELSRFIRQAKRRKLDKVLIIHGKGNNSPGGPVLPKIVRQFLENCSDTGQFGFGDNRSGGRGATWVIIR